MPDTAISYASPRTSMVTILHISDLHRDADSGLTTASLLESLHLDRERYLQEGRANPDVAVVSGDVVYGVANAASSSDDALQVQYDEALDCLGQLAAMFFDGDRERIVIVPGNHDVSHPHVLRATVPEDLPQEPERRALIAAQLAAQQNTTWRWVPNAFALRRIVHPDMYKERFAPFARFYEAFYQGRRRFSLEPGEQYAVHDFPGLGLVVVGLSSCCDNDLFNRAGRIHPDCVAGATREIAELVRVGRVPIAVWHHNLAGGPRDGDYVDAEFLQSLMDGGFIVGLHGHHHRPQFLEHRFTADRERSIGVISAGTLCGGPRTLPMGRRRAYNLVELDLGSRSGAVHVREMRSTEFSTPVWAAAYVGEFAGSKMTFDLNIVVRKEFATEAASVALELLRAGDASGAFARASAHLDNPLARRVAVEALLHSANWQVMREFCSPPRSSAEVIALLEALYQVGEKDELARVADLFSRTSDVAVTQSVELARRRLRR